MGSEGGVCGCVVSGGGVCGCCCWNPLCGRYKIELSRQKKKRFEGLGEGGKGRETEERRGEMEVKIEGGEGGQTLF